MRILIAQIYGLGNAILTTPLIKALATIGDERNRRHEIHVVIDPKRKASIEVLRSCPGVKKCWNMGDVTAIQNYHFDVIIMCCDYPQLIQRYKIPRVEWGYLKRQGESKAQWFQRWSMHEIKMAFRIARKFGYKGDMPEPHVPVNEAIQMTYSGPRLGLGIGYYKGDKWSGRKHWGNGNFAEIARRFKLIGGMSFILGDKKDFDVDGKHILAQAGDSAISLCGKLGLRGTLGALKQCDIYVGNDTGLTHAAAAFGIPTISIFKPWNHSFIKNRPYGKHGTFVVEWDGLSVLDAVWHWVAYEVEHTVLPNKSKRK